MAIRTRHEITEDTWFVTFTCYDWLPLFELTNSYDLVYKWLKLIDDKYRIKTIGFVIVPNHVHVLLYLTDLNVNLNTIMANAKRFMAYDLVKRLDEQGHTEILTRLAAACSEKERAKGQLHKVFEPSFDAKPVYMLEFLYQKLDYIPICRQAGTIIQFRAVTLSLSKGGNCVRNLRITRIAARRFMCWAFRIRMWMCLIIGIIGLTDQFAT